jgi:hypothetical protein
VARFAIGLAISWAPVRSRALPAASVALRVVSAMAIAAMTTSMIAKTTARMLRRIPHDTALQWFIAGLALTLSDLLLHLTFLHRPEGLIDFCSKAKSSLRLYSYLKAGIKSEVVLAFLEHSTYFQTHTSPEKHALVVIVDVSTFTGSDNIGTD